jgi:phosphoribosylaminoimidazolecarboxamide formyltransferase / IMP cyclohydrolase
MDYNTKKHSIKLRYGLNPKQAFAELRTEQPSPIAVLSGVPSYINLLDALRGWKLAKELKRHFDVPAAASYKHVNPAGVGLGIGTLDETYKKAHFLPDWPLSPLAVAYIRARQADRIASYGDFIAVSDPVDVATALVMKNLASDGVIAPGYDSDALSILRGKRNGRFLVLTIDPSYEPKGVEAKDEFGLTLVQEYDRSEVPDLSMAQIVTSKSSLDKSATKGLLLALIVAKHTQSNAVVIATANHTVGIGAGQQSRIAATRIACEKAETYLLYDHPKVLDLQFQPKQSRIDKMNVVDLFLRFDALSAAERAVVTDQIIADLAPLRPEERASWIHKKRTLCLASDAAIPFRDNIDRAASACVTHVIQPGASKRDSEVTAAADKYGIVMLHTGVRHFLH